jgi:flagellar FliJ protein
MKKFHFRLATLLRLREQERDEFRAHLAQAFAAETDLLAKKQSLLAQSLAVRRDAQSATQPGYLDVDSLRESHRFHLVIATELACVEAQAAQLAVEIEQRRAAVVVADREVRILEKLRSRQQQRHNQELLIEEVKQLDEIASRRVQYVFA